MREFFRAWRRKAGVVTLVLALVSIAGWVRSSCFEDVAAIPIGGSALTCVSLDGLFVCGIATDATPGSLPPFPMWKSRPYCNLAQFIARGSLHIDRQINGFGVGEMYSNSPFKVWIIPYWSIAVPLTVASTLLLLTGSRKSVAMKTDETSPAMGS